MLVCAPPAAPLPCSRRRQPAARALFDAATHPCAAARRGLLGGAAGPCMAVRCSAPPARLLRGAPPHRPLPTPASSCPVTALSSPLRVSPKTRLTSLAARGRVSIRQRAAQSRSRCRTGHATHTESSSFSAGHRLLCFCSSYSFLHAVIFLYQSLPAARSGRRRGDGSHDSHLVSAGGRPAGEGDWLKVAELRAMVEAQDSRAKVQQVFFSA